MMRIKRIRAVDMQSARDRVRELGPGAVIISARRLDAAEEEQRGWLGGVEIIAGIDEQENDLAEAAAAARSASSAMASAAAYGRTAAALTGASLAPRHTARTDALPARLELEPAGVAARAAGTAPAFARATTPAARPGGDARPLDIDSLRLRPLRPAGAPEEYPPAGAPAAATAPTATGDPAEQAYALLLSLGLSAAIAEGSLAQALRALPGDCRGDLATLLESALSNLVLNLPAGLNLSPVDLCGRRIHFIGPAGSGKTTSLLKAAFRLQRDGASVAVISADASRLGNREQLESYCHLLDLEFRTAGSGQEIDEAVAELSERTIVLIDTPPLPAAAGLGDARRREGAGPIAAFAGLEALRSTTGESCIVLVVSAGASERELRRLAAAAARAGACAAVVTHLDECAPAGAGLVGAGSALNALAQLELPPLFLGTGRDVLADCEPGDPYELVIAALESAADAVAAPAPAQR